MRSWISMRLIHIPLRFEAFTHRPRTGVDMRRRPRVH